MIKNLFIVLLLSTALFTACNDEKEDEVANVCNLEQVIYKANDPGEEDYIETFTYDGASNITKISSKEVYESNGETITDIYEILFTYENGKVVKADTYDGDVRDNVIIVEYTSDNLLSKLTSTDIGDGYIDEYRITYSGTTPTQFENWDNYSGGDGGLTLSYSIKITFTGENVTKEVEDDGDVNLYTYDNKINPFKGNVAYFIAATSPVTFFSTNNVVTNKYEYVDDDGESYISTYEYNADGYPVKETETEEGVEEEKDYITEYVYNCK